MIALTASVASDKGALQLTFAAGRIPAGRTGKHACVPAAPIARIPLGSARVSRVGFGVLAETEFSGLDSSPHAKFLAFRQKPLQFHYSTTPTLHTFQDPMELNHILLFTAIATAALVVLQAFQPQSPGARARAAVVLIASALAWLLARPIAGWLSAIVWCALLVVPAFLQNRALGRTLPIPPVRLGPRIRHFRVARRSRTNYR